MSLFRCDAATLEGAQCAREPAWKVHGDTGEGRHGHRGPVPRFACGPHLAAVSDLFATENGTLLAKLSEVAR